MASHGVAKGGIREKARVEEGGGAAEQRREGGFGPFGRRGRGSVMPRESTFPVAFFPPKSNNTRPTQPGNSSEK